MKRGLSIKLTIGAAVLLLGSFSSARARQLYDENQFRHSAHTTRVQLDRFMRVASAAGLSSARLAPIRGAEAKVAVRPVPSGSPLWAPQVESFYHNQLDAYRGLAKRVASELLRVTERARVKARNAVAKAHADVASARRLDLNTTAAQASLRGDSSRLAQATTPRDYGLLISNIRRALGPLRTATAARQAYVSHLLEQSKLSVSWIVRAAQTSASAAGAKLSLLSIFTSRAATESNSLRIALSAVQGQSSARAAAVKEADVQAIVDQISADYARTVPPKMIVVSTEQQWARMYQGGRQVFDAPVTTGGPELPTDRGIFHIYLKASPFIFHSPWPPGSPYYYNPTPVQYWMPFDGGEGLHDASWRSNFGSGSNLEPTDLGTGNFILGTHGCVNLPLAAAQFVWSWAPVGTTVVVN